MQHYFIQKIRNACPKRGPRGLYSLSTWRPETEMRRKKAAFQRTQSLIRRFSLVYLQNATRSLRVRAFLALPLAPSLLLRTSFYRRMIHTRCMIRMHPGMRHAHKHRKSAAETPECRARRPISLAFPSFFFQLAPRAQLSLVYKKGPSLALPQVNP